MARTDPQLNFRIPAELRDKLAEAAKANNRSMTGELIARLDASFDGLPPDGLDLGSTVEVKRLLMDQAARLRAFAEALDRNHPPASKNSDPT